MLSRTTSSINATVTDHDGHDISSSFKKLVYYYNPKVTSSGGHDDGQDEAARPLNTCDANQGLFVESSCNYEDGVIGSIRSYTHKCLNHKKGVRNKKFGVVEVTAYNRTCEDQEICVNGPGREGDWSTGSGITAYCVNTSAFVASTDAELADLSGTTLTALLTSPDMRTPFMGSRIDVETEVRTSDGEEKGAVSKECVQCVSLTTEKLSSNTTSIMLSETWVMGREMALSSVIGVLLMIALAA